MPLTVEAWRRPVAPAPPYSGISIAAENEKAGATSIEVGTDNWTDLGFAREFSTNAGDTVEFSCDGDGTRLDIYRIGWYGGSGWHKVTQLTNTATQQPEGTVDSTTNALSCTNWSVTASWDIPADATPGLYVGIYRTVGNTAASQIPFVVRADNRPADIIVKTSETTWHLAYNVYGGPSSPLSGRSLYTNGEGGTWTWETDRALAVSYHRPVVTRSGVQQTYWMACEAPTIRFLERMGYNVKYVASKDLDRDPSVLSGAKVFISSGHDEYWSQGMRDAVESFRDAGGHCVFQSANEVFWRTRFVDAHQTMVCYKDTQQCSLYGHDGGDAFDPVTWTGTWRDTRWANRDDEKNLTGTDFRMNGVKDLTATFDHTADYATHPFWRNTDLPAGTDFTVAGLIGFEGDSYAGIDGAVRLSATTVNIDGDVSDDNGEFYDLNGDIDWGISAHRAASGAVVIGFGTCQWGWGLDATHDRGGDVENLNIQQAEYNMLRDLGAAPETPITGITESEPADLSNYEGA